ncbi:hypothetical protein B0O80DRAFT_424469 [Mortierella sp. GBAus27b]|nr:hypothetical protein B0O80DRAFT_424469 [Mortierella sp. GBAus27b]
MPRRSHTARCLQGFRIGSSPVIYIQAHLDTRTGQYILLWRDIQQAFPGVGYVRNCSTVAQFITDDDFALIDPLRIKYLQGVIFNVVLKDTEAAPPGYSPPGYTSPGYISPGYTFPGYTSPGRTFSGHTSSGYTFSGHTSSGYTFSGHTSSGYTSSGYTSSGYTPGNASLVRAPHTYVPVTRERSGQLVNRASGGISGGNLRITKFSDLKNYEPDWAGWVQNPIWTFFKIVILGVIVVFLIIAIPILLILSALGIC